MSYVVLHMAIKFDGLKGRWNFAQLGGFFAFRTSQGEKSLSLVFPFKWNIEVQGGWTTRGKLGPGTIGGLPRSSDGLVLVIFLSNVGILESNDVELLSILELEALCLSVSDYNAGVIVKSDSMNAESWVSSFAVAPWRFQFHMYEIVFILSHSCEGQPRRICKLYQARGRYIFSFFGFLFCNCLFWLSNLYLCYHLWRFVLFFFYLNEIYC